MVNLYTRMIIEGTWNFNKVPAKWSEGVRMELDKRGYVINEDGTVSPKESK